MVFQYSFFQSAVKARTSLGQVRHEHGRDQGDRRDSMPNDAAFRRGDRRDSMPNDAASRHRSTGRLQIIPDLDADEDDAGGTGQADPTITQVRTVLACVPSYLIAFVVGSAWAEGDQAAYYQTNGQPCSC